MQGIITLKSLKAPILLAVSSLLLGASLSACQSTTPTDNTAYIPVSPQPSLEMPVADIRLSVDADSSFPIVNLMPFIMNQAEALKLTPAQIKVFADYRKTAAPKRMALQRNEKALRGQLRQALMAGADDATTTALMRRISATEMAHMNLRRECIKLVRSTLMPEQFDKLMQMYEQSLKR